MKISRKCLNPCQQLFHVPYELHKIDHAQGSKQAPQDHALSHRNWYRQDRLAFDVFGEAKEMIPSAEAAVQSSTEINHGCLILFLAFSLHKDYPGTFLDS